MSRSDSPLLDAMIFAFGAQRSGTWWLQRMLTAHPDVSGIPSETYLFERGIRPLLERFHHGVKSSTTVAQLHAERDVLLDATRDFCDRVLLPYREPGARYLCERSPGHAKAVDVIAAVYPDARLIHIIRDGRDVARSLAARQWGPGSVAAAAREWRESVEAARAAAPATGYLEVRYEALLADLDGGLRALYEWLVLQAGDELMEQVLVQARRPLNEDPKDPRVATGKWRDHFSDDDLAAFDAEAGDLLAELGYDQAQPKPADSVVASLPATAAPRTSLAGRVRSALARAAGERPEPPPPPAPAWEVGGGLAVSQELGDRLLTALHSGDEAAVSAVLHPDVTLRVVSSDAEEQVLGIEEVAAALMSDDAWRRRQLRGEAHPGRPNFSFALAYPRDDGAVSWRIVYFEVGQRLIKAIALYRVD
ncbi:MAG: sulfotransferase [Thermoleophilaceae bacterium]